MKRTDDRTILQPSLESGSEVSTALHEKTVKQPGVWPVQGQKPELRVIKLLSYSDLGDRIGYEIVAVVQCSTKYPAMRALSLLSRRDKSTWSRPATGTSVLFGQIARSRA